jgi:hypothetical protein
VEYGKKGTHMKWTLTIACAITAASLLSGIAVAAQHAEHHAGSGEQPMNMEHAEQGMGFSQTQTTHHFLLKKDGGIIQVEANEPKDLRNRDMIRTHLTHIAHAFAAGDFSDPLTVHDKKPDGAGEMQRLKEEIHYTYKQTAKGGRVVIKTTNPQALQAIHQFLRFQIKEHRTGDSLH